MGYTKFAKYVRKLMIDKDENLTDLSKLFDKSTAYVSSVFTGKKNAPEIWIDEIVSHYGLDEDQESELVNAFSESKEFVKVNLENQNVETKRVAVQLQRNLDNLSNEDLKLIEEILNKKGVGQ